MKKIGFLTLLSMAALTFTLAFPAAAAGPKAPRNASTGGSCDRAISSNASASTSAHSRSSRSDARGEKASGRRRA